MALDFPAVFAKSKELSKTTELYQGCVAPCSVRYLVDLLDTEISEDERFVIYVALRAPCHDLPLEVKYMKQMVAELPNYILALTFYSFWLTMLAELEGVQSVEAVQVGTQAFELARSRSEWVKYAGVNLARIAARLGDYVALERALVDLIADSPNCWPVDYRYEFEFLHKIDRSRLKDPLVLDRYAALQRRELEGENW